MYSRRLAKSGVRELYTAFTRRRHVASLSAYLSSAWNAASEPREITAAHAPAGQGKDSAADSCASAQGGQKRCPQVSEVDARRGAEAEGGEPQMQHVGGAMSETEEAERTRRPLSAAGRGGGAGEGAVGLVGGGGRRGK